jgi:hypothetical protein
MQDDALTPRLIRYFTLVNHELATLAQYLERPLHLRPGVSSETAEAQLRSFEHWHQRLQYAAEELLQLARAVEATLSSQAPTHPDSAAAAPAAAVAPFGERRPHAAALTAGRPEADPQGRHHVLTSYPEQVDLEPIYASRKPAAFELLGTQLSVDSWRELYLSVLALLARHDAATFRRLPQTALFITRTGRNDFAVTPTGFRNPLALDDGIYTEGKRSAAQILYRVGKLLDTFQLPRSSFAVLLAPET